MTSGKLLNLSGSQCPSLGNGPSLLCQSFGSHPCCPVFPTDSPAQAPLCQPGIAIESRGEGRGWGTSPSLPCPGGVSASSCLSSCWVSSCESSFQQEALGRWALGTSLHSLCSSSLSGGKHWLVTSFLP